MFVVERKKIGDFAVGELHFLVIALAVDDDVETTTAGTSFSFITIDMTINVHDGALVEAVCYLFPQWQFECVRHEFCEH